MSLSVDLTLVEDQKANRKQSLFTSCFRTFFHCKDDIWRGDEQIKLNMLR